MEDAKRYLLAVLLVPLVFAHPGGQAAETHADTASAAAKAAIKSLAGRLKNELQTAMQSGGPTAAIQVCNLRALPLTGEIAAEHQLQLARVSLKNRNPANAPNAWQAEVLRGFEKRRALGEDVSQLSWSETVETDGAEEFRFMQAIPTVGVCLACHGTALSPDISQVLNELYPDDRATGFSEGEIRGAFVATKTLADQDH